MSTRADAPFYAINCASVPPQNIGPTIFGIETINSDENTPRKIGLLERANDGTLFIDEISLLEKSDQTRLSQFLQDGAFTRIGSTKSVKINVSIIAGTTKADDDLLADANFLNDLYYRVNAMSVTIPPLFERTRDIALLAKQFLSVISSANNIQCKSLDAEALPLLESYGWPGDVQQLKNVLEWSLIMSMNNGSDCITVADLPPEIIHGNEFAKAWEQKSATLAALPIKEAREEFEKEYLLSQIKRFNGNISQTAKFIGMDRAALHRKIKLLDVKIDDGVV
jgi:two-component system nitrogen regulation response regulator NtrX